MNVRSLPEIAGELQSAMRHASKRDAGLGSFAGLADRAAVKTTTLQSWILGNHEPRARALAQVAAVLSISMDRLLYSETPRAFRHLGIDDLCKGLKDTERADVAKTVRLIIETSRLGDRPELVVAAFLSQVEACAEMCRKLH